MLDLTVIILTKDESLHIARCIENVKPIAKRILVIDSFSTDDTQEIARNLGAEVIEHPWPGNQADQFNWALDNILIDTEWILRLDADEFLSHELIEELKVTLPSLPSDVNALVLPLGRYFMGKKLKHGIVNGVKMIRMFRNGFAKYESRLMDEHLTLLSGKTITLKNKFYDDNRMSLSHFIQKHNNYALREALTELSKEYGADQVSDSQNFADEVKKKRSQKGLYSRMPLFWRSFGYFIYRYFIKLGFLDGKEGFMWDFLQGWWYRTLVDAKIFEIKKTSSGDPDKIRQILKSQYNIPL